VLLLLFFFFFSERFEAKCKKVEFGSKEGFDTFRGEQNTYTSSTRRFAAAALRYKYI